MGPVVPRPAGVRRAAGGSWRAPVRALAATLAVASVLAAGCGSPTAGRWSAPPSGSATGGAAASPSGPPAASDGSPAARTAPGRAFPVGVRRLDLNRGAGRPLPTTVWYPATGPAPGAAGSARSGVAVADGRFPVVLFSHGLTGKPESYAALTVRLAAAGFVVAAPAYPYTNADAAELRVTDIANQPADAFAVIDAVVGLDGRSGDPFAGHLDTARVGAAGHSAGGFTTAGMLATRRDARLAAAVVIAGGSMGTVTPPSAEVLFVHGDADQTVTYSSGRSAYDRLTWPKSFLTVVGGDHARYLGPGQPGFDAVLGTVTDFLRATLYGDGAARRRLPSDGSGAGVRYEQGRA